MLAELKNNLILDMEKLMVQLNNGYAVNFCCVIDQIYYIMSKSGEAASSGMSFSNAVNIPSASSSSSIGGFILPIATPSVLGGVKIGSNISVTPDGTISVVVDDYWTLEANNQTITYGYLYNRFAVVDERNMAPIGFHLSTIDDYDSLGISSSPVSALPFRDVGSTYWNIPDGTNTTGFTVRGSGYRDGGGGGFFEGVFHDLKLSTFLWSIDPENPNDNFVASIGGDFGDSAQVYSEMESEFGNPVRFVADSTTLEEGETGTVIGNDGKVYITKCINGQEWMIINSAETKYQNGDLIPVVTDGIEWSELSTGARCAYDNDLSNVFMGTVTNDINFRDVLTILSNPGIVIDLTNKVLTLSLELGETELLPYRGDRGKTAYDHTLLINNPHAVTKTQVGLSNVDNIADVSKNVLSATKLTTARNIAISGGVTGTVAFDGTGDVTIVSTLRALVAGDIPNLSWTKITTGKPTTLAGYGITDAMSTSHVANSITAPDIVNWNTAFSWGNHALVGYLTSITKPMVEAVLTGLITSHTHNYEPIITAGTSSQYWRGDKSWQTLDKAAVGLSNVPNLSFSGSNTGDNAVNTLYSSLVTNATHTGDATGATALIVVGINGTLLSGLTTGLLKNTTGTGIPSIAVAGVDYLTPAGDGSALTGITYTQVGADAAGTASGLMTTHNSTYNHANIANGQTAFTWGNHAGLYLPLAGGNITGPVTITTSSLATGLDSISQGVGVVGTGTGVTGYGVVGYAFNIPIVAANLDTTPTGVKTCLVLTNDNGNTVGVAPTFGLSIDWDMPWLGNPLFTSRAGRMICEWTDTTYTAENSKFVWDLRSSGSEITRMTLSHLGALTINSGKLTPLASAPTSPTGGEIYANVNGHIYYNNAATWIQLDGGVSTIGVEWVDFTFSDIAVSPGQIYTIDLKAAVTYNIMGLVLESDTGTITLTCKINGVAITGLTTVDATNVTQEYTASALNAVAVGQRVTITTTNLISSPAVLTGKLKLQRV